SRPFDRRSCTASFGLRVARGQACTAPFRLCTAHFMARTADGRACNDLAPTTTAATPERASEESRSQISSVPSLHDVRPVRPGTRPTKGKSVDRRGRRRAERTTTMTTTTKTAARAIASLKLPRVVPALILYVQAVIKGMTSNPYFPTPMPPIATIQAALDDLQAAQ